MKMDIRDCWGTPAEFMPIVEALFGRIGIDVCAEPYNAKSEKYIRASQDPLRQRWLDPEHGIFTGWCNYPYSAHKDWLAKSISEGMRTFQTGMIVLCPISTGSAWWHEYVARASTIYFLRERIPFVPPPGVTESSGKQDSALVLFSKKPPHEPPARFRFLDWKMMLGKDSKLHSPQSLKRYEKQLDILHGQ